jgi:hypothetical protein
VGYSTDDLQYHVRPRVLVGVPASARGLLFVLLRPPRAYEYESPSGPPREQSRRRVCTQHVESRTATVSKGQSVALTLTVNSSTYVGPNKLFCPFPACALV